MRIDITKKIGTNINKQMIGLFFEDINYSLDGGLYAEMIENRAFEFVESTGQDFTYYQRFAGDYGWTSYPNSKTSKNLTIKSDKPMNKVNPHYLEFNGAEENKSFCNKAYDGVFMKKDLPYNVSFFAKSEKYDGNIEVSIIKDKQVKASSIIATSLTDEWIKYEGILVSKEDISSGDFVISLSIAGIVCFDFISMIPSDAVLGLFRRDIAELLKDMKPGFLRFPGGCIVEGNNLENRYQWKKSVGQVEERKWNWNRWAVHGNDKDKGIKSPYSHYNQSLGIGYYEYFLLCEYLGASPLPVVNVGIACQFMSNELVKVNDEKFQEFIDDCLDLIEFANGSVDTKWGKLRSDMGHPEPFNMNMIGIGNEQWETEEVDFFKRYEIFEKSIHEKYKNIKLIGSAGPDISSEKYTSAWDFYYKNEYKENFVYAVDEHYYVKPEWLCENVHFYDKYPRNIKVFAGEYAAHHSNGMNCPQYNDWDAALSEAAFLTGIERNSDIVVLASYAPLLARIGYAQWSPDMIWFDGEGLYGSPSYYVQKMYSTLMGTNLLEVINDNEEIPFTVSYDKDDKIIYVKLVNVLNHSVMVKIESEFEIDKDGEVYLIEGTGKEVNSIKNPFNISIKNKKIEVSNSMNYEIKEKSFHVIKMKCK